MPVSYEYKVVPSPTKGRKGPGIKGADGRFAHGIEAAINMMAVDGWEYLRAETLPSEERSGLTSSQTVFRSILVFRRALEAEQPEMPWDAASAEMATKAPEPVEPPAPEPAASDSEQPSDPPDPAPEAETKETENVSKD